jgi:hypothetical protein
LQDADVIFANAPQKCIVSGLEAGGSLLRRRNVLVLYDPPEVEEGSGAYFALGRRQLIVAISTNSRHRFKAARKENSRLFRYLSPPTLSELGVMLPVINPKNTLDVFWARLREMGCLPRYLVDEGKYMERMIDREQAIKAIRDLRELNAYLDSKGWVLSKSLLVIRKYRRATRIMKDCTSSLKNVLFWS